MRILVLSLLCFVAVLAEDDPDFPKWLDQYGYSAEAVDYGTWKANMEFVKEHRHKSASFTVSLNKFAHLKPGDLSNLNNARGPVVNDYTISNEVVFKPTSAPPSSVDWRTKGVVTPVVDQGELYSSYPFSASDAVASFLAIKTGNLTVLSVEEVTDCCHYHPCSGRFTKNVFDCIHNIGGLCSNDSYKRDTNCACHNATCTPVGNVAGGKNITSGSESELMEAVATEPVQVVIDASQTSFQLYTSGIYDDPDCSPSTLDHSMLLVGYGTDSSGAEYWILKNSWGTNWGEQGYMRMARNKGNMCGIASMVDYPY